MQLQPGPGGDLCRCHIARTQGRPVRRGRAWSRRRLDRPNSQAQAARHEESVLSV